MAASGSNVIRTTMAARKTKKKRPGAQKGNQNRLRSDVPSVVVPVRMTPAELASYRALARYRKQDFSGLVRELCNAALLLAVTRGGWQPPREKGARGD